MNAAARIEGVTIRDLPWIHRRRSPRSRLSLLVGTSLCPPRHADNYLRPRRQRFEANYEQVFGDSTYGLATAVHELLTTWSRLDGSGKHVLAFRSQASWAGDDTPVYDRLYAGGFRSLRGFEFRGVGPHSKIGDYVTRAVLSPS